MAENLAEVDRIANDPAAPTFENTIAAMEPDRAERWIASARSTASSASNLNDDAVQAVEREMSPKLAAFSDKITQNEKLVSRALPRSTTRARLGTHARAEAARPGSTTRTSSARARSSIAAAKEQLSGINQRLATLYTNFSQNVLADEGDQMLHARRTRPRSPACRRQCVPRPRPPRSPAARRASGRSSNTRSSVEPFLTYSDRRELREKAWRMFVNRGDNGGKTRQQRRSSREILAAACRAREASRLPDARALAARGTRWRKTPERAMELMEAVWTPAVARVHEEVADMQAVADQEKAGIRIEPWDYRYYAEKVRKAKYDLDETEITPYLQLENLREGMFYMAGAAVRVQLQARGPATVPVFHPDVRVWEVNDPAGQLVGLWYFDPYARQGKRSGAWMNAYRTQERFDRDIKTIVSNNSNFREGQAGRAGAGQLGGRDDALPRVRPCAARPELERELSVAARHGGRTRLRGVPVAAARALALDARDPQSLRAARTRPASRSRLQLVAKIERAEKFNEGFKTVEYLGSALVDMKLHLAGAKPDRPDKFERETLAALGMPHEIVMRHRTPQFTHVFAGDGYSAGYYSYLWSGHADGGRLGGVHRGERRMGQGGREAAARQRLLGRQHGRPGRRLPRVPRPRPGDLRR